MLQRPTAFYKLCKLTLEPVLFCKNMNGVYFYKEILFHHVHLKESFVFKTKATAASNKYFLYFLHLKAFLDLCCHKEFILLKARPYVTIKYIYLLTLRHNNLASWPCTDSNLIPCSI